MQSPGKERVVLGLIGDLLVDREHPGDAFSQISDVLAAPDIVFGNLEAAYSDDPHPAPGGGAVLRPASRNLDVFASAGFDVMSLANNHIVDLGHDAMLENRARLRKQGVKTCGAGENLAAAREPAILEAGGLRIAFLAYASVFPMGYEARSNVPGLAPLRAYDLWRPLYDNYHIPGTPPRAQTVPDATDLQNLAEDIAKAKQAADLVVTSFHWGDFLRPFHLTDHELRTAHWCIDQGVDMVIGHHHHALRGMEWYRGKPIFYGLGHFVFDLRLELSEEAKEMIGAANESDDNYAIFPRKGWPLLPLHADTRMTIMAWATAGADGFCEIGFLPCRLQPDGRVVAVDIASEEGREVAAYLERCNSTQKLNARITEEGAIEIAGRRTLRAVPAH